MSRARRTKPAWHRLTYENGVTCADLQASYFEWNDIHCLKDNPHVCPFAQILTYNSWKANPKVFEEYVRWLVLNQHFEFRPPVPGSSERDIMYYILVGLFRDDAGQGTWEHQLSVVDFFLGLGYRFPRDFYLGRYVHSRLCAYLASGVHARLLDLGLPVAEHWGHTTAPGDAQFIFHLWHLRQTWLRACIVLIGVLRKRRRHDLGACINGDMLKIMVRMVWNHRWDTLVLDPSFYFGPPPLNPLLLKMTTQ